MDTKAAEFFCTQMEDPANCLCCDSGIEGAAWASISHGIYLSIGAAGLHRSLGVKVSFVQSTTMDSWKPVHVRMMELGGNQRFQLFLKEQGVPEDIPIREKYSTRAAEWYRRNLKALAEGLEAPSALPPATGHLPATDCSCATGCVLDQVFATVPHSGSTTTGGVPKRDSLPSQPQAKNPACVTTTLPRKEKSVPAAALTQQGAAHGLEHSGGAELALSTIWRSLLPKPLVFGRTNCPTADRLKMMSSGNMEGFGSNCLPNLLPTLQLMQRKNFRSAGCHAKPSTEATTATIIAAVAA